MFIINDDDLIRGADIEAQDEDSFTPLLTAVAYGQMEAMDALLQSKCSIDVVDRNGKSVVFIAAEENQSELLKVSNTVNTIMHCIILLLIALFVIEYVEWWPIG